MRAEYSSQGSYPGILGWPTSVESCVNGVCTQIFEGGTALIGPTGSFTLRTGFDALFRSLGGASGSLGLPRSEYIAIESPNGPGSGQTFQIGTIYAGPAGPFGVVGIMRAEYSRQGSYNGVLGWPTAGETCANGVCEQRFQGGTIYVSGSVARTVRSAYDDVYRSLGGPTGSLGLPTSGYIAVSNVNGSGSGQQFARGTIYSSAAGTFAVTGGVRAAYWAAGSNGGRYGWPSGAATCTSGTCTQAFQGGVISAPQ